MRFFNWIGRLISGAFRLAAAAFIGGVALFSASLDFALGIVTRLYERFDAHWVKFEREAAERRAREGRRPMNPFLLR